MKSRRDELKAEIERASNAVGDLYDLEVADILKALRETEQMVRYLFPETRNTCEYRQVLGYSDPTNEDIYEVLIRADSVIKAHEELAEKRRRECNV